MSNIALCNKEAVIRRKRGSLLQRLWRQRELQLFVLLPLSLVILFSYVPLYGLLLSFKDYNFKAGIWGSSWVGLEHFREFVSSTNFFVVMKNTISISVLKILFCFPIPIAFAIMLTELNSYKFRSLIQTVSYLPHFLSWIVCYGVLMIVFDKDTGILNDILMTLGIVKEPVMFFGEPKLFWPLLILTENWKEMGWGSIIYVAAIMGIDPQINEAAVIDGARRFQRIFRITLPYLYPTIAVLFIFAVGNILNAGFDQIFIMTNQLVAGQSKIIDLYVYEVGLRQGRYDFATAVGLFKSVIGFILVWLSNRFADRYGMGMF